jgi:hypothetical protein
VPYGPGQQDPLTAILCFLMPLPPPPAPPALLPFLSPL